MGFISRKKAAVMAGVAAVAGGGIVAVAYFTTTGSGSGTGSVGTSAAVTVHQFNIAYSNSLTDNVLLPGTSATVTFTVDNPSSGHQYVNAISLASWTSDKTGCDSLDHPTWITMPDVSVAHDYAPGNGQTVTPTGTITFNDLAVDQSVCKSASLTFSYPSN